MVQLTLVLNVTLKYRHTISQRQGKSEQMQKRDPTPTPDPFKMSMGVDSHIDMAGKVKVTAILIWECTAISIWEPLLLSQP